VPQLPNSVRDFRIQYNYLIDPFTPSLPTSLTTLNISQNDTLTDWTVPLIDTLLNNFAANNCLISGPWDVQFPSTIRTINLSVNEITSMDFNLVSGVTTLRMNNNAPLTGFTNLSNNNTVQILELYECGFSDVADLFTTTLPSSLTSFSFSWNSITGSTWPTNAFSNPGLYFVELIRCGLNTTSVDNIINDVYNTSTVTTGARSIILGPNTDNPSLGDPNQNRSLASDTAYDALIAAGWNITLP
jgi:hypothetical protein